ncbi:unnamed protein product [Amoebophrya sp. A120]|nr:unnamed protein product [Amoebophrya sp. A120]|eukprot:GSA120T00017241001.1
MTTMTTTTPPVPPEKTIRYANRNSPERVQEDAVDEQLKKWFLFTPEELLNLSNHLLKQMQKGLEEHGCLIQMLPTFIEKFPTGKEQQDCIAVDLGGTNLRVMHVKLTGKNGEYITGATRKKKIPRKAQIGTHRDLFGLVAEEIGELLKDANLVPVVEGAAATGAGAAAAAPVGGGFLGNTNNENDAFDNNVSKTDHVNMNDPAGPAFSKIGSSPNYVKNETVSLSETPTPVTQPPKNPLTSLPPSATTTRQRTNSYPLGFTFSFPLHQTALGSGLLTNWAKGFCATGVVGEDVCELLENELKARNIPVTVQALINDTAGALMSGTLKEPDSCAVGVIIGTGTNCAYLERVDRIHKLHLEVESGAAAGAKGATSFSLAECFSSCWEPTVGSFFRTVIPGICGASASSSLMSSSSGEAGAESTVAGGSSSSSSTARINKEAKNHLHHNLMCINCECGAFTDTGLRRTKMDEDLDAESSNAGAQHIEKMIAGHYLGELVFRTLVELQESGMAFVEAKEHGLLFSDHPHTVFETHMMASTVASPYNDGRGVLRQIFGPATWDRKMSSGTTSNADNASRRDILTLFKVCSVISGRSAMMAAVMIVSMVRQILSGQPERKEIVIPVDGTVYKSFPKYKERLNDHLMSLVQAAPDIPKDIVVVLKDACEDGSCIGAAAVLAAACREDNS